MTNIVNLSKHRKQNLRTTKAKTAAENRVKYGRTKAQKEADRVNEKRRQHLLDGDKCDTDA